MGKQAHGQRSSPKSLKPTADHIGGTRSSLRTGRLPSITNTHSIRQYHTLFPAIGCIAAQTDTAGLKLSVAVRVACRQWPSRKASSYVDNPSVPDVCTLVALEM